MILITAKASLHRAGRKCRRAAQCSFTCSSHHLAPFGAKVLAVESPPRRVRTRLARCRATFSPLTLRRFDGKTTGGFLRSSGINVMNVRPIASCRRRSQVVWLLWLRVMRLQLAGAFAQA
jgi:hypothetical protein